MKYMKYRLRTTMTMERLTHVALLSVEYLVLREVDIDELVHDFDSCKARKVPEFN